METIHTADQMYSRWDLAPVGAGAVVVARDRVVALGAFADLRERWPTARVRTWPGALGPGRVHDGPLPDAPTPRERVHAVLKTGATAVVEEHLDAPGLRAAAERNDLLVLPHARPSLITDAGRADLAVLDADGACIATVCAGRLVHRRR
ncbi:hypothetical protein JS756_21510 [Streptomyces actuosus]|uniref:Aminodeoxyfutalosine deaminase/Imidazolonepropionase-like composite domain-containing protein n=1 Tax=Streptomyces actuosus TaxID=1885 RepID=A0ABS2VU56_STRAS|nr:hypothetical protein [Streptomyces actuosus]MBN0046636.1 hypothetical protein [Streptomyces actuosus]